MPGQIGYEVIGQADTNLLQHLREEESRKINEEVLVEREWWEPRILHDENVALAEGRLMVVPDEGNHFRLIGPLRRKEEPNLLNPQAYHLLLVIQDRWLAAMSSESVSARYVRLSITSLFRSLELQKQVMQETYLASRGISAHNAGAAMDFDPNGYFSGSDRKSVQAGSEDFCDIYPLVLEQVLQELVDEGSCHVIWEKGIKVEGDLVIRYTACYHVCVSPDFMSGV